uniref:Uncharacterized protein n=1 Tax=Caenorhabditis japonica TaxID=281687 RepID=A0A8R1EIJ6_CAEJA
MESQNFETLKTNIDALRGSIEILKNARNVIKESENGYVYTNDSQYTSIFERCQIERPEINKKLSIIQELLGNKVLAVSKLRELFDGFYTMITEVEVEESVVVYVTEIEEAFKILSDCVFLPR